MGVTVKVPATSANMGSGYDSIGIALDLYNVITMEESDHIDISDVRDDNIPKDENNLIYQCAKKVYDICGKPLTGLKIVEDCAIPQTRGLGSSSACTVAGILARMRLLGDPLGQENIIDLAASIEGHPDNSTPAILGGFCVALLEYGKVWSVRVPMNGTVDFITFIPDFELSTEKARAALPQKVAHHDAVFNLARAALLAGSLTTGKLENVGVAVGDCLHQPYRFDLIPAAGMSCTRPSAWAHSVRSSRALARPSLRWSILRIRPTLSRAQMYCEQNFPHWTPIRLTCDEVGATVTRF